MPQTTRHPRILMLDLDSWDGLTEWGSSLRRHGLPVIRVVRPRTRMAAARRVLDRWQFGADPIEVAGALGDLEVRAALAPPTVDVQGPEAQLQELDGALPPDSPSRQLLQRVPDSVGQDTLYDKWRMTELAMEHDLQVPQSWEQAPDGVLPLVVKGRISAGGQDVDVAHDPQELRDVVARMTRRDNGGLFYQRVFSGPVLNAGGVAKDGRLLVHAIYEASPPPDDPYGPPVLLRIIDRPDVQEQLSALIRALGYTGIFCIDYVQDEHDHAAMVDFNPRVFGGWLQLQLAGVDFIGAYQHALGLAPAPAFRPLPAGTTLEVGLLAPRAGTPGDAWRGAVSSFGAIGRAAKVTGWRFAAVKGARAIVRAAVDAASATRSSRSR